MASKVSKDQFDVIVIGAGINGAGIARDAAMRGLNVLLLDKGDIGGGTSSWSTRLIHGGLRYLEHGELWLVRESLRERATLMKIAPHLVRPLRMLVPIYKHARRGVWTIRAGMVAYDVLSFGKSLPHHRMLSVSETLQQAPGLNRKELIGAAVYFDAQVEFAERLVLENVLSAVEHGATVITYARVVKLLVEKGRVCGVEFTRVQSPTSKVQSQHDSDEHHFASAPIVINAAGPWIDQVLGASDPDSSRLIGGTKGSHLIVAPFRGAPDMALYVEAETDRRPFFIIPWNGNYLIGTTDIRHDGDLDHVRIEAEEIEYLVRETNRVIPEAQLTRDQILYTYSGVRPLPFVNEKDEQPGVPGGAASLGWKQSITRKHFIRRHPQIDNLFSIVGGKLTTYRSLAEETVDLIFKQLGRSKPTCTTDRVALPGATEQYRDAELTEFPEATSDRLARIYGTRASAVANLITADPSLGEVFDPETGAIAAEIVFAFKSELAQTLADCLLRRTMVGLNSSCGLNAVEAAASIAQKYLGWSASQADQETAAYRMNRKANC